MGEPVEAVANARSIANVASRGRRICAMATNDNAGAHTTLWTTITPPFAAQGIMTNHDCVVDAVRLEEWLNIYIDNNDVHYPPHSDYYWLDCDVGSSASPENDNGPNNANAHASILGLLEDYGDECAIHARAYRCHDDDDANNAPSSSPRGGDGSSSRSQANRIHPRSCTCHMVEHNWQRQDLGHIVPARDDVEKVRPVRLDWIDLSHSLLLVTGCENEASPARLVHLLRSVLGTDHDASPWMIPQQDDARPYPATVVCLIVPVTKGMGPTVQPPLALIQFRVSDVCPSWYLHAVVVITTTSSALLVYRRLPVRKNLSGRHPITNVPAPFGCLWECYTPSNDEDNGEMTAERANNEPTTTVLYRPVAPPYVNALHEYGSLLTPLLDITNLQHMMDEARNIGHWTAWPEQQHYKATASGNPTPWKVFPLCHCFPAHDVSRRMWIAATCRAVPRTMQVLHALGDLVRTALLSRLDAHAVLEPHTGWADLANHVVRLHVPLLVPPLLLCGTWVDGCVAPHRVGELLCFDDSKIHRAYNYSDQARVVLILDLARPASLPIGTAVGGHSDELDVFIAQMKVPT